MADYLIWGSIAIIFIYLIHLFITEERRVMDELTQPYKVEEDTTLNIRELL